MLVVNDFSSEPPHFFFLKLVENRVDTKNYFWYYFNVRSLESGTRRGVRVVYGAGLENQCGSRHRGFESHLLRCRIFLHLTLSQNNITWYENYGQLGEVPKWLKGLPWKGSRSLIAARGFKSLLLRLEYFSKIFSFFKRKLVDMPFVLCYI